MSNGSERVPTPSQCRARSLQERRRSPNSALGGPAASLNIWFLAVLPGRQLSDGEFSRLTGGGRPVADLRIRSSAARELALDETVRAYAVRLRALGLRQTRGDSIAAKRSACPSAGWQPALIAVWSLGDAPADTRGPCPVPGLCGRQTGSVIRRSVPVRVVQVGHMRVIVRQRAVSMRVAVRALRHRHVRMVVVPVVVGVRMLVLQRLVGVLVTV